MEFELGREGWGEGRKTGRKVEKEEEGGRGGGAEGEKEVMEDCERGVPISGGRANCRGWSGD